MLHWMGVERRKIILIVIEGIDRTGKTKLAQRLADAIGGMVRHSSKPTRPSIEEYETSLDGHDPRSGLHLILDRFHVGEYVWPKIFERESDYDEPTQKHVEMFMHSRAAVLVYGIRDKDKLKQDLVSYNEPLMPEDLDRAERLFADARAFSGRGAFFWDYERCGDAEIQNIIDEAASEDLRVKNVWDAVGPGWVGHHYPAALLVGDELGPLQKNTTPPHDVPFAPYRNTSGHYLLRAIDRWNRFAIVNSLSDRTGKQRDLTRVCEAFGNPNVIALGKRASQVLARQGISHVDVPHPQYWRRFHHHKLDEYKYMIEEAACL